MTGVGAFVVTGVGAFVVMVVTLLDGLLKATAWSIFIVAVQAVLA